MSVLARLPWSDGVRWILVLRTTEPDSVCPLDSDSLLILLVCGVDGVDTAGDDEAT